jgi:hypothetical protein
LNASSETWKLGSQAVQVSHLEKRFWPEVEFTKGDMLRYYGQIAPVALPYFKDRPVTLRGRTLSSSQSSHQQPSATRSRSGLTMPRVARSSATPISASPRSAAIAMAMPRHSPCSLPPQRMAARPGQTSRSHPLATTPSIPGRGSDGLAARSAPTAMGWSTSSPTSSPSVCQVRVLTS